MGATVIDKQVPDGDKAVDYTVRGPMCELAYRDATHPCILRLAKRLKAEARTDEEAVRIAFRHVVRTIPYKADPDEYELVVAPKYTLGCELPYAGYKPHGDCDCQSTALAALLLAMGYNPLFRVVAWRKWDYTHVNVIVELPGRKAIPLDAVMKLDGWNRQKPANYREKVYRCPMMVRALADNVADDGQQRDRHRTQSQLGCGCAACQAKQGLSGCGCGGQRSCCSKNERSGPSPPVMVNVNTGTIDSRRWTDTSERADIRSDESRWVQFPMQSAGRQTAPRPIKVTARQQVIRPVIRQQVMKPLVVHTQKPQSPPLPRWKEFT